MEQIDLFPEQIDLFAEQIDYLAATHRRVRTHSETS